MDLDRLKEILDWMTRSSVAELQISEGDFEVHLKKSEGAAGAAPGVVAATPRARGHKVTSTGFGVIHLRPAPDSPPFVVLGQTVSVGQSLCTIEAMKVFSPIEADRAGVITGILVEDGTEVEAGHPLFRIE